MMPYLFDPRSWKTSKTMIFLYITSLMMSRKTTKRQFKITVNFVSVASFGIPNSNLISLFSGSVAVRNNRLRGGN
jgi:hypothetical protein